ncbi:MAG TPA: hypothetical protein VG938_01330 [Verrucomicrobiae bacterium]|jgi:hypothetical protein|nr:hypothetical protein [Verrucomicrobiae bacterium]
MKIRTDRLKTGFALAALAFFGLSRAALAGEPQALELIKPANDYVGKKVRDKITGLRSEKSVASVTPNIWYVVYYDHDSTFKTAEVKFGAGQELEVRHPMRQPFAYINDKNLLDPKILKVDSDKAIKTAMAEPLLEKLNIRATQLWLQNIDGVPTWKVRLWAQKLRHPNDDAEIGDVFISADDGKVIRDDLHINRVD